MSIYYKIQNIFVSVDTYHANKSVINNNINNTIYFNINHNNVLINVIIS